MAFFPTMWQPCAPTWLAITKSQLLPHPQLRNCKLVRLRPPPRTATRLALAANCVCVTQPTKLAQNATMTTTLGNGRARSFRVPSCVLIPFNVVFKFSKKNISFTIIFTIIILFIIYIT